MIRKIQTFIWAWGPPLILMGIIFFLSSRQKISVSEDLDTNFIVFKTLHMIEYACLMAFYVRAHIIATRWSAKEIILVSALMAILYGLTDEIHQTFVPTRTGKVHDILVDSIGICTMYIISSKYFVQLKKYVT